MREKEVLDRYYKKMKEMIENNMFEECERLSREHNKFLLSVKWDKTHEEFLKDCLRVTKELEREVKERMIAVGDYSKKMYESQKNSKLYRLYE